MNIPGFSADASVYRTTQSYSVTAAFEQLGVRTNLQLQRVSGPEGPIGLPGQDCYGACLHVCMLSGRLSTECISRCMSTCTGSPFAYGLTRI
jgi:hypothetical protein